MKQKHNERKSSSGISPIGSQALNGYIPSASATSLISFFPHNFRVKPVIALGNIATDHFVNKKSTQVQKELGKYVKRNTQNRIISRHEITVFPHDFRVKPVIALANMMRYHFDE